MSTGSGVTQIDTTYLDTLKNQLQDLQTQVEQQIKGYGTNPIQDGVGIGPGTLSSIEPVTSALKLQAGAASFDAGATLNAALSTMGGTVHDQLEWLHKVLGDMIDEINTTVASLKGTESLNNESVDQLITDFQNTISDINTPAGSSGTGSGSK
jgi:hypothetical protein